MLNDKPYIYNKFLFRPLTAEDTVSYKYLRQRILKSKDAQFYCDSYERERQLSAEQWKEWCTEKKEHTIFGAFVEQQLIGVTMITRQGGILSPVVEWEAVWLDPQFRGIGLGKELFKASYNWTIVQEYRYVVVFIRDTKTHCLDICRQMGFEYLYSVKDELWADGSVSDLHAYVLDSRKQFSTATDAGKRYAEVYTYLNQGAHAPTYFNTQNVNVG